MDIPIGSVLNGNGFEWNFLVDWRFKQNHEMIFREVDRKAVVQMNKQAGTFRTHVTVSDLASLSGSASAVCCPAAILPAPSNGNLFPGGVS
jgi:hypothetical protein